MGRGTSPIHDGIGPGLDGSIPPLSWISVLVVGLRLPIIDVVRPENLLDLVGDLILGGITDELVHSTILSSNVLTKCLPDLIG